MIYYAPFNVTRAIVFHCYELSDEGNAAFMCFVYIQKAFEIGNCYLSWVVRSVNRDIYAIMCPISWLWIFCTFKVYFIIKMVVTINLPLKPFPQIVIIFPVIKKLYFFIFFFDSIKGNYRIDDLLDVNTDYLFIYFSHYTTVVL